MSKPRIIPETNDKYDDVLAYCMFDKGSNRTWIAYDHLYKFLKISDIHNGQNWLFVRNRLRISLGIDIRYINDISSGFIDWGIIKIIHGNIVWVGIPKDAILAKDEPITEHETNRETISEGEKL